MKNLSLLLLFFLTLFVVNNIALQKPIIKISKQNSSINLNQKYLRLFNFGFSSMFSSWLWVKTLMESDIEPYRKKDLNSWMFLRFFSIIELDPRFYEAYLFGGKYLSIIKDDLKGAELIFRRGLVQFPEDFWINVNAAHNYLFELGLPDKAIPLYKRVQFQPIAKKYFPILPSLIAKLEKNQGDPQAAFNLLEIAQKENSSQKFQNYFRENLYALKAEIDLNCLNSKGFNCNRNDYFGNPYLEVESGIFAASRPWKRFQLSSKTIERIKKAKSIN